MNVGVNYKLFYEILLNLRESFYSYGRIDDSNSKLDEIIKIIMLSYYCGLNGERFSLKYVKEFSLKKYNDESKVAMALRDLFNDIASEKLFMNDDQTSIFGANPSLNIQPSENLFAEQIISEIEKIDFINLIKSRNQNDFDILNECFGHFVRENFRNNKEDAQYMTPAEISAPVLDMIFSDFEKENYFITKSIEDFRIVDPTCGVGTLIIESAKKYLSFISSKKLSTNKKNDISENFLKNGIFGQDKVDRMVRLSKMNSILLGSNSENIITGNSILATTNIDKLKGKVDFIFTNPPFGADYNLSQINYENFGNLREINFSSETICSELLMLFKCIALLKPNGKLAIVLPDSVFSAKGNFQKVRDFLIQNYYINAVIELPSVTFAQAGTRTKTSILYITNKKSDEKQKIAMGICENIGYLVKEKSGVPVKIKNGKNEILEISRSYCNISDFSETVIQENPSLTLIEKSSLINNILNPSFYSADRLNTLNFFENSKPNGFEIKPLSSIVDFKTIGRKNYNTTENIKHISVLHINPDCTVDFQQVLSFNPVSKGRQCFEGDILFSKINPRIPRMTVVPNFDKMLVCSNEFEILQPKSDIGAYVICMLLKTDYVYKQIENLTSGTSSSHSRIKREQLAEIKIPYPTSERTKQLFKKIDENVKNAFNEKYNADLILRNELNELKIFA